MSAPLAFMVLALTAWPSGSAGHEDRVEDKAPVDFAREVRPILSDKCFQCHGPDPETREAGLRVDSLEGITAELSTGGHAVVAGDVEDSELLYRIAPEFEDDLMPPERSGKSLSESERSVLRRWIEEGAPWDEHWSFQRPVKPTVAQGGEDGDAIDALLDGPMAAAGLAFQPEADAATLQRRVSLDLTGLPPAPEESAAFHADVALRGLDAAYRAEVKRLMASERYGVHMARTWLDAARYADTHGLHLDNRRSMWPYRDWVVRALNDNKPFDEFVIEQLAGDLLPNATLDQQVASGFNRCNPTSAEGGMIAQEYLSIYAKDRADTTAKVFLGLTLECAQCHDHKFDPISQRDYYAMYGFFNSMTEEATDRNIENPVPFLRVPLPEQAGRLEEISAATLALTEELDRPNPELDERERRWIERTSQEVLGRWKTVIPERVAATEGVELTVEPESGVVVAGGANPHNTTYTIDAWVPPGQIEGLRLDALVPEGRALPGRASNDNFVLTSVEVLAAPADRPEELQPIGLGAAVATHSQDRFPITGVLDPSSASGWAGLGKTGDRSALLVPTRGFGWAEGTELRVKLVYASVHSQHGLARFRLAVRRSDDLEPALRTGTWHRAHFPASAAAGLYDEPHPPQDQIAGGVDLFREAAPGVPWTAHPEYSEGRRHLFESGLGVHFLVQRIEAREARRIELLLGSDDGVEAWLNGELVHSNRVARGVNIDQDRVPLSLAAGDNELVLKVVNTGGAGGFSWRLVDGGSADGLPPAIELAMQIPVAEHTEATRDLTRVFWRRSHAEEWAAAFDEREALAAERATIEGALPSTMVSEERSEPRPAHVLMRGAYDKLGEVVEPATPSALPPLPADAPRNRLGLARWIVSGDNPLTARVWVNRAWQHFFGAGIVATPDDFGNQGKWPSHPELLDWLAVTFVESGWDMKAMHERLVLSRAYRQDSNVRPNELEVDPDNRLLARSSRFRLDAEVLRDQALHVAGLLDETMGGPGVRPYQPEGIWFAVGYSGSNTVRYAQGPKEDLHRRSLYTFWKRTAPPPNLTTFDAPMRDACTVRRERTNTPLQALVMLNDPTYVEAARFIAARVLREAGPSHLERAGHLFQLVASRTPTGEEADRIARLVTALSADFEADPLDAVELVATGDLEVPADVDTIELATWTLTASAILNLDEVLTRN